ncbi:MAG: MBL fold metallo-hydrolase [Pseudomonadales bacterium]|nr:MBL fold metallo-hydrolase [Pseudomonadales bacterium]
MGSFKKPLIALLLLLLFIGLGVWQRHLLVFSPWSSGETPPLLAMPTDVSPDSYWYDDYFLVEPIDSATFAIAEPRYAQLNYSYLIIGTDKAILFDAGPGVRDIRMVTRSLTDLPITFIPSHFHFDHIGNEVTFENVAVVDLPYLRDRADGNVLTLTWQEHLGSGEGFDLPMLEIDEWLEPDSLIELGERQLQVLYTPGHTTDSVSLLDLNTGAIFSGDFLYPGNLYAFLPTSHMGEYLAGAETVLAVVEPDAALYGAHRGPEPVIPQLGKQDVEDLQAALLRIKQREVNGIGTFPVSYPVNSRLNILAEPRWLQSW